MMNTTLFKLHMMHRFWRFRLTKESRELYCVRHLSLEGATVLDIGANKGVYSYWLSRAVGSTGKVFAFEPQPELAVHLARLKSAFQLQNVQFISKALSETSGQVALSRDFCGAGHASLVPKKKRRETVTIQMTTVDDFVRENNIKDVAFMKIDVEGHELSALKGSIGLLKRSRPILLLECFAENAKDGKLFSFLQELGYDGFYFTSDGISPFSKLSGKDSNYLFGPKDFIASHGARVAGLPWRSD
jgi:FkbM family methyltransferase